MEKIVDRFLRYVAFDTTSNPDSQSQPSTNKQFALLEQLRKELVAMGLENVVLDKTARPSLSTRLKAWFSTRKNSPS